MSNVQQRDTARKNAFGSPEQIRENELLCLAQRAIEALGVNGELRELAVLASDASNDVIGSRSGGNLSLECFEGALLSLRSIRVQLEGHADKLETEQAVPS